jgi:hypothetical protein
MPYARKLHVNKFVVLKEQLLGRAKGKPFALCVLCFEQVYFLVKTDVLTRQVKVR